MRHLEKFFAAIRIDHVLGRAVQVDPMKSMLKPPSTTHLKLIVIHCFQLLLSGSTCAATARVLSHLGAAGVGAPGAHGGARCVMLIHFIHRMVKSLGWHFWIRSDSVEGRIRVDTGAEFRAALQREFLGYSTVCMGI
jgi:hypothetical protein